MDLLQSLTKECSKFSQFQNYNDFCVLKAREILSLCVALIDYIRAYEMTGEIRFTDALESLDQEVHYRPKGDSDKVYKNICKNKTSTLKKILSPNYEPPAEPLELVGHFFAFVIFYSDMAVKLPEGHRLFRLADVHLMRTAARAMAIMGRIKFRDSDIRFRQPKATAKREKLINENCREIWEKDLSDEQRNILSFEHPYSLGRIMGECWDKRWTRDRNEKFNPAKKRGCPDINSIVKRIKKFREIIIHMNN